MKVTPVSPVYRPKFNVKKERFQPGKALDPIRIDFIESPETPPEKAAPIIWQNDDKQMYIGLAKMFTVIMGIFLLTMWLLARGYII